MENNLDEMKNKGDKWEERENNVDETENKGDEWGKEEKCRRGKTREMSGEK